MSQIEDRKDEHIDIVLRQAIESRPSAGFDRWRLKHRALPEIALDDVDLSVKILGRTLAAPLIIGAMTGGTRRGGDINETLARAAQARGIGLALGSGRIALEHPETLPTFQVRSHAPDVLLLANLGAVQLNKGVTTADIRGLVDSTGADGINLHVNPIQEAIQPGGDTDFRGLLDRIDALATDLGRPVLVKAVGAGIDRLSADRLAGTAIAGVEVAGLGGTNWSRVEGHRAVDPIRRQTGELLGRLGLATTESLRHCRRAFPKRLVVGSGGVRDALDAAVCLALGADVVACARPFLARAEQGIGAVIAFIDELCHALRVILFACGARRPADMFGRVEPQPWAG